MHRRVLQGQRSLSPAKALAPSARCRRQAPTRQRTEAPFPRGKAASPNREATGPVHGSTEGPGPTPGATPGGGLPPGLGRGTSPGRGTGGQRQVVAEWRGPCVSRRLPHAPPGTAAHLPSAGDRPAARRGGEARTGSCHRSSVPFLSGAPAACRPPGPSEPRRAAAAALTSVRREQAGAAPQSPQQAARSSQGRHKGCHLPGAAARARGALGNGVRGAAGEPGRGRCCANRSRLGHGMTGSITLEKPSEIIESNLWHTTTVSTRSWH